MAFPQKHAIVFGASGISGWRVVKELLQYPTPTTFGSVTGITNRPLTVEEAGLPADARLRLVSGVDLTGSLESIIATLQERVPHIVEITHAYLYAYVHSPGQGKTLVDVNAQLVDSAVLALKALSPRLEHVTLQTGGKVYGIEHFPKVPIPPTPWKESLPRVQDPSIASQIFYYRQVDILAAHARGSSWKWTEIRPDAIVGFAPTSTAMNIALPLGVFFALWRAVHGPGATIPFPGPKAAYERTHTETPMGAAARFQIFASLRGGETHEQVYNIGTSPSSYAHKWPLLAAQFELVGAPPAADEGIDVAAWVRAHRAEWGVLETEHGLQTGVIETVGWDFLVILTIPIDREYDTSKARELGFQEEMDLMAAYKEAWGLMAASKLLPPV
ncbi:hypothetical protein FIBSPDRAFT_777421 [Athelia psychrophila]|uniref:PRISE-like Rossmann-fold domain-containing protein n=1 Tax=Athelia psychrophila TaxID=1759441 RepID=A0A166T717_9AGAM|nr:hypothetical protein FIBSPDRAFT_777421 [Fibularhizoctonia sp. CBS 109695]